MHYEHEKARLHLSEPKEYEPRDYATRYKQKSIRLEQTDDSQKDEIDWAFDYIFAFLDGWNLDSFVYNTDNCWESLYDMTIDWNTQVNEYWCETCNNTGGIEAYIFNSSDLISGVTADSIYECYMWGYGWYEYGIE